MTKYVKNPDVDEDMVYELKVFIDNDADLYRQQYIPIIQNLVRKKAAGTYDASKAPKLFGYLVESGAKQYVKEFYGPENKWHDVVNIPTRKAISDQYVEEFEAEYKLGNWDQYIPKKYLKKKKNPKDCGCGCNGVGRCKNPASKLNKNPKSVKQLKSFLSR
jgi:hypothetical protein